MRTRLFSLSFAILSLLLSSHKSSAQIQRAVFTVADPQGVDKLTMYFYSLNDILVTAEIVSDQIKEPLYFRIENRLKTGFVLSISGDLSSRNRLIVRPEGKTIVLIDRDGRKVGVGRWTYSGPVNGVGTACDDCLDENESLLLIKRASLRE